MKKTRRKAVKKKVPAVEMKLLRMVGALAAARNIPAGMNTEFRVAADLSVAAAYFDLGDKLRTRVLQASADEHRAIDASAASLIEKKAQRDEAEAAARRALEDAPRTDRFWKAGD